jgi:phospholipid/cholesterol/gamma-HCH transport system permease protein
MQATFDVRVEGRERILALGGDWTVWTVGDVDAGLRALSESQSGAFTIDVSRLGRMDVAGAWLVERTARAGDKPLTLRGAHDAAHRLLATTHAAARGTPHPPEPLVGIIAVLDRIGRAMADLRDEAVHTLDFLGRTLVTLFRTLRHPKKLRWVSIFSVMESAGLNAMPIICMLSFFIGVVVAFLGSRILGDFGASVFTVELVAFSVLREFGIVITAVLLAGRTDSSFTAEIGAMKMRQEIDAMRVLGIEPMEAIVVPRLIAMLVMTPVLAFAAAIAGLLGGLLICWVVLNISPVMFITRVQESVPVQHFWVGMIKAPVMAVVLAIVGCRHGLETGGDVTSLGRRVTSSVVQAIFLVVVIDALFAIWFLEMDW